MEQQELMNRLNAITRAEFETNWNLGEIARTVKNDIRKDASYNVLARELKEELNRDIDDEHVVQVSGLGFVVYYKKTYINIIEVLQEEKKIFSENSYIIPYSYAMGKKVSKKVYEETLRRLK